MNTRLLLIILLTGSVFTEEPPDVECKVMHLKYVECLWKPTPNVNFTFYSRFYGEDFRECESYIVEDGLNVGCQQSADDLMNKRFNLFYTKLEIGEGVFTNEHELQNRVQLAPPSNLTVQYEPDLMLSFKWSQIFNQCMESEVRYRVNYNNWVTSMVRAGREDYYARLPSNNSRYELQVRSRVSYGCGESIEWSEWSEPVVWGSLQKPDVDCTGMHLRNVKCLWKLTPNVNFTFYSRFYSEDFHECESYIVEDGLNVGCLQSEDHLMVKRFNSFYTKLEIGEAVFTKEHQLKNRVKLAPPANVTVQFRSDSNLWYKWDQINNCVDSEIRYRVNHNNWEHYRVSSGRSEYCINLPSNNSRYELQVRRRVSYGCGESIEWSDWSEPVVWGSLQKPDVDCTVMHLRNVKCLWKPTPNVNFTFYSRFYSEDFRECESYIVEDGLNVGCQQSADNLMAKRFNSFYTKLEIGEAVFTKEHQLKNRVKLAPPANVTVQFRSDSNLWYKWDQMNNCVDSEIRYRVNHNNWEHSRVSNGRSEYCINLPSNNSRYELQVRRKVNYGCGESIEWSDWSEPVVWGSHNSTESNRPVYSLNVWNIVMYGVGAITLVLLILMLLHHERIRIILIPVVPKPSLVREDIEEWLDSSKGLKKVFEADYTEKTCPVREYCPVLHSDSETSDSSNISVSTDQTDFSGTMANNEPNDLQSSSTSVFIPHEERHMSV